MSMKPNWCSTTKQFLLPPVFIPHFMTILLNNALSRNGYTYLPILIVFCEAVFDTAKYLTGTTVLGGSIEENPRFGMVKGKGRLIYKEQRVKSSCRANLWRSDSRNQ